MNQLKFKICRRDRFVFMKYLKFTVIIMYHLDIYEKSLQ